MTGKGSLRDGLDINVEENEDQELMHPKMKVHQQQMAIRAKLEGLPAPMNEVEISMPDLATDDMPVEEPLEEDAADADRRRERLELERQEQERLKQSQPVQRGLPRPALPQTMLFQSSFTPGVGEVASSSILLQQAESLLHEEMASLVTHDAFAFPIKGAKPPKKPVELEDMSTKDLKMASELLEAEVEEFKAAAGGELVNVQALEVALKEGLEQFTFLPQAKRYVDWRVTSKEDRLEAAKHTFELMEAQVQRESKRAKKLEDKLERTLGGYAAKAKQSADKARALHEERETIDVETEVFRTLANREEKAIESRVEELREDVEREKQRNAKLQNRYKNLKLLARQLDEKLQ